MGSPPFPRRSKPDDACAKRGGQRLDGEAVPGLRQRRRGGSPPLCSWRAVTRERVATHSPSESPSHLTVTAPFDKGAFFPCGGSGEHPNFKSEQRARALRTKSNTAFV